MFCALALWLCLSFLSVACSSGTSDLGLYARALAAYRAQDWTQAQDLASAQLERLPRRSPERYPVLLLRARALLHLDRAAEARRAFTQALSERPGSAEARLNLARLALSAGDGAGARKLLDAVLCDDPEDLRALRLAAVIDLDAGDIPAALASLERAIAAGGELGLAYLERSRVRFLLEDRAGWQADLEAARGLCDRAASGE